MWNRFSLLTTKKKFWKNWNIHYWAYLCQTKVTSFLIINENEDSGKTKKGLWHRCFPVNFTKFLRTPFLTEHIRWLFLQCASERAHYQCITTFSNSWIKRWTLSQCLYHWNSRRTCLLLYEIRVLDVLNKINSVAT